VVGIHQRQIRLGSRWHSVIFVGKARANTAFQPTPLRCASRRGGLRPLAGLARCARGGLTSG